jgi:hypothetical protein
LSKSPERRLQGDCEICTVAASSGLKTATSQTSPVETAIAQKGPLWATSTDLRWAQGASLHQMMDGGLLAGGCRPASRTGPSARRRRL